jgi:hypothetical protein
VDRDSQPKTDLPYPAIMQQIHYNAQLRQMQGKRIDFPVVLRLFDKNMT